MTNSLTTVERQGQPLAIIQQPKGPVDVILNSVSEAIRGGTDPAVIREQVALLKDVLAMKSKGEFDAAMLEARREMKEVLKDSKNESNNSRFATLEKIDRMAFPVYDAHGFTLSYRQAECPTVGWTRLVCDVSHSGGHHEYPWLEGPMDDTGMKGSKNKTGIQGMGSTWTYLQRRLCAMIFNIRVVGDDNDGNRPKPPSPMDKRPITESPERQAAKRLWELLKPIRGTANDWAIAHGWLRRHKIISETDLVTAMSADAIAEVWNKSSVVLEGN